MRYIWGWMFVVFCTWREDLLRHEPIVIVNILHLVRPTSPQILRPSSFRLFLFRCKKVRTHSRSLNAVNTTTYFSSISYLANPDQNGCKVLPHTNRTNKSDQRQRRTSTADRVCVCAFPLLYILNEIPNIWNGALSENANASVVCVCVCAGEWSLSLSRNLFAYLQLSPKYAPWHTMMTMPAVVMAWEMLALAEVCMCACVCSCECVECFFSHIISIIHTLTLAHTQTAHMLTLFSDRRASASRRL